MWRNWDPLILLVGNVKWYDHFGKQFCSSSKVKSSLAIWPYDPAIGPLDLFSKILKYMFTQNLVHVYSGTIQNRQKAETTQTFINCWMHRQNVVLSTEWNIIRPQNGWSTNVCFMMNLKNIMLSQRNQTQTATFYMISFIGNVQNRWIFRTRK